MTLKIPYKSLLLYLSLVSLYRLALDWIYRSVIAVSFAYAGFIWKPSLLLCAVSWALLTLFSCLMWPCYRNPENRISYEILFILFLISLVPFTVMVYAGMCPTAFWASNALYWFLLIRLCVRKRLFRAIKITGVMKRIQKAHVLIAVVLLLSVFYICARYSHFRLNFDLSKIYDLRSESREYDYPTLLKYIF